MSQEFTSIVPHLQVVEPGSQFQSVLFASSNLELKLEPPDFFRDLNLDQVIAAITAGREEYNLQPFFYTLLPEIELVNYRQDVFRDLQDHATLASIRSFSEQMRTMRGHL